MEYINLDIDALGHALELKIICDCFNKTNLALEQSNYPEINKRIIKQLKYRMIVSNIIVIVSTWEQQLMDFIYKFNKTSTNAYNKIKEAYIKYLEIDKKNFEDLAVYRNLVGVFKHGKSGDSFNKLAKKDSKFTKNSVYFEELNDSVTFNLPILNIEESDVEEIGKKFEEFWLNIHSIVKF